MSMVSSISVLPFYGIRYYFSWQVIDKLQAFWLPVKLQWWILVVQ